MRKVTPERQLANHPDGWMAFVDNVEKGLMRKMDADDREKAMRAYLVGTKADKFVEALEAE